MGEGIAGHAGPHCRGIAQVQPRQPATFVQGSKEDAADAVATYTAAMKARSAAAAIGRTSPLRPKACTRVQGLVIFPSTRRLLKDVFNNAQGNPHVLPSFMTRCWSNTALAHVKGHGDAADLPHLTA